MKRIVNLVAICAVVLLFSGMAPENSSTNSAWIKAIVNKLEVSDYFLTTDVEGNLVITGNFINQATFQDKTLHAVGNFDIFVAKYTPGGTLLWVQQGGGSEYDMANVIRTDNIGNIYITGYITGISFFGDYIIKAKGKHNVFTGKYNKDGKLQWIQADGAEIYYEINPKKREKLLSKLFD
ncbi:MAG: hypothetical protein Q8928_12610 [Bacteroidota bacterium]|nr:hypothetical protein [Bacteroidota bacterium]